MHRPSNLPSLYVIIYKYRPVELHFIKHNTLMSTVKTEELEVCASEVRAADETATLQQLAFG